MLLLSSLITIKMVKLNVPNTSVLRIYIYIQCNNFSFSISNATCFNFKYAVFVVSEDSPVLYGGWADSFWALRQLTESTPVTSDKTCRKTRCSPPFWTWLPFLSCQNNTDWAVKVLFVRPVLSRGRGGRAVTWPARLSDLGGRKGWGYCSARS